MERTDQLFGDRVHRVQHVLLADNIGRLDVALAGIRDTGRSIRQLFGDVVLVASFAHPRPRRRNVGQGAGDAADFIVRAFHHALKQLRVAVGMGDNSVLDTLRAIGCQAPV